MGLTTPPPPYDVAEIFPELAGLSRITVRLHPRPGAPSPADSSLGGPPLWPLDDPWPFCASPDLLTDVPSPVTAQEGLVPRPCVLAPERVREYPIEELPDELYEKIEKSALIGADLYEDQLSVAPGTKVGGWIPWVQAPETVTCRQGHEMEHLLTIGSWEHDPGTARWAPLEERHLLSSDFDPEQLGPSGLMIGDAGNAHLFVCLECPDRPVGSAAQWS